MNKEVHKPQNALSDIGPLPFATFNSILYSTGVMSAILHMHVNTPTMMICLLRQLQRCQPKININQTSRDENINWKLLISKGYP